MKDGWKHLRQIIPYLPNGAKQYMYTYMFVSSLLAMLDIVALMALAFSVTSILSGAPINVPLVGSFGPDKYVWVVLAISAVILVRSILALIQQWFAARKFADFEMALGRRLFNAYLGAPWVDRLSRSTSELVRMADVGVAAINAGLLLPFLGLPAMLVSSISVVLVLFVSQPLTAVTTLAYLGIFAVLIYVVLSRRTVEAGRVNRRYSFKAAGLMTDMVGALKEITLRNKFSEVSNIVQDARFHATRARANIQFLGSVPRFVLDFALIGGFLVIGGATYLFTKDWDQMINAVVLFAVSGVRLVPALTGFQSTVNVLNAQASQVRAVLRDIQEAEGYEAHREVAGKNAISEPLKQLRLENVSFTYPNRETPAINNVSLDIKMGTTVALVGESGSGKSTLVDLILGLFEPQQGTMRINDQNLHDVLLDWRSRIGYVPQEVSLFDGTIEQNVALTWKGEIDRDRVIECLKKAKMWEVTQARPGGLHSTIGERGIGLSGGQRQRLGIARALYDNPSVLILDEATSALDTNTESEIAEAIHNLRGEVTIISIAHRLSTVKDSDEMFFMQDGEVLAQGSFAELVRQVPQFAHQASLAGLTQTVEDAVDKGLLDN